MSSVSLYEEAFVNFRKHASQRAQSTKDHELLAAFLQERGSPSDTKEAAESLQADTQQKYGSKKIGDVEIPAQWIHKIMGNINNFLEAGSIAMKGAPESVGLAWFAVKLTLTAIQNNYELYSFFGSGLSDISEIMIIIAHYDRLYDERANAKWKPSALVEKLFGDVISAYEAVLDFSYAIKCHLKAGTRGRILHGLKDLFGGSKDKFVSKLGTIAELKGKIVEGSQGAFQDKTLSQLAGVGSVLQALSGTVNDIKQFQAQQEQWHKESMAKQDVILTTVQEMQKNTKRKSPWDYATDAFEANIKALNALKTSGEPLDKATRAIHPGTCQWAFEHADYASWESSEDSSMLLIYGPEGSGKSTVLASIVNRLKDTTTTVFYLSCATAETSGTAVHYDAKSICNTFLSQIYELAKEAEDVRLLEACNDVFKNPKSGESKKVSNVKVSKEDNLPDFAEAFARLAELLKKNFTLVVDGINDTVPGKDQEELYDELRGLLSNITDDVQIKILLGCSSPTPLSSKDDFPGNAIDIDTHVRDDMATVLKDALKNTPGLSASEQEEAEAAILAKAGSQFRYICEAAIPFIQEPFVRPLSARLDTLPAGLTDRYAEQIRKLKPNYVGLLQTALKWTLLAPEFPGMPTGREIMDAFYGTYESLPETTDEQPDDDMFPLISQAELDQIREAGDLFLTSYPNGRGDMSFYLRDAQQVREFCLHSAKDDHGDDHDLNHVCPRCKSEINQTVRVSVDLKQDHLQMAITCLRHINNPVFQKRCGLLVEFTSGQEADDTQTKEEPDATEEDAGADVEPDGADGADGADVAVESGTEHADEGKESPIEDSQDDAGYESDESLDHGEMTENEASRKDFEAQYEFETLQSSWERIRYELQFWVHHVRQAEDLWTSEERSESELWKHLFAEFDKFASNTAVFNRWQAQFPNSWVEVDNLGPYKPLHIAALFGLTSIAEHLMKNRNADPNEKSRHRNALHVAAVKADRLSMVKLLLESGVNVNDRKTDGTESTALNMWLVDDPSMEAAKVFLGAGADPKLHDSDGWNALHYFAYYVGCDPEVVNLLLENGVDINAPESQGQSPLHFLVLRREVPKDVLALFISKGASVNAEDNFSARPLQIAAIYGEVETLRILLAPGVTEIDDPDDDGNTALHQAALGGHSEVIQLLTQSGSDPSIRNKKGFVALHEAARFKFKECVKVLLDWDKEHQNTTINLKGTHNRTPFFNACLAGDGEVAQLILDALIENKRPLSEINQPTKSGRTPLRQAAEHGLDDVIVRLIQLAADQNDFSSLLVNQQDDKKGMAPLHRAAWGGHLGCVRHLVDSRLETDISLKDLNEHTALEIAYQGLALRSEQSHFEEIVSILIGLGPEAARHDAELVATVASNGSTRLLKQLWRLKADLNVRDQYGWTPLEIARKFSRKSAEEFLSQQQAWAGLLPSRWGTSFPSTTMAGAQFVSEDGTTVTVLSDQRSHICVSSDRPVPAGLERYYFEVTLSNVPAEDGSSTPGQKEYPIFAIGFCTVGGAAISFPGWPAKENAARAKSYGFHGDDGGLFIYSDDEMAFNTGWAYGPGDTVGCGVDFGEDEIFFTLNGERVEHAHRGVSGRLFPILGLKERVRGVVNFGGEVFVWGGFGKWGLGEGEDDVEGVLAEGGEGGGGKLESEAGGGMVVEVGGGGGGEVVSEIKGDVVVGVEGIVDGVAGLEVR